jgi:catechol 2,3-dioxygenase-like lactoylglutathione lyase family enzyme
MNIMDSNNTITEMRIALTSNDFHRLLNFYCAGLGLEPTRVWDNEQGNGLILNLGLATLELFDEKQADTVDQIEAGQRVSGQVRLAFQVPDLEAAMERLIAHGAILVHQPVVTPWGDINVRFQDPDGLQITLFQKSQAGPTA